MNRKEKINEKIFEANVKLVDKNKVLEDKIDRLNSIINTLEETLTEKYEVYKEYRGTENVIASGTFAYILNLLKELKKVDTSY